MSPPWVKDERVNECLQWVESGGAFTASATGGFMALGKRRWSGRRFGRWN